MKKHVVKNQNGSSRMDTVLKLLLIAFIALLAFSSGVYFGKQLSDSDYQLKALESDFHGGEQAKGDGEESEEAHGEKTAQGEGKDAIREEDIAALSEKAVANEKHEAAEHGAEHAEGAKAEASAHEAEPAREVAEAPKAEAHEAHEAAPAHAAAKVAEHAEKHAEKVEAHEAPKRGVAAVAGKPDLSAAAKAAQRVATNAAPVENPKPVVESRVPSSLPKTVGTSGDVEFTVQVASYPTAEAAKDHANELVKKGFPAFPVEASVNGKVWYRVSVGSFRTQKDATVFRSQLLKQTGVATAIVQKITR